MNTSLTIDLPEVALFDSQELKLKVIAYVKQLAIRKNSEKNETKAFGNWREMTISPEVQAMTFDKRVDLGTTDYKELLEEALEEKYQ